MTLVRKSECGTWSASKTTKKGLPVRVRAWLMSPAFAPPGVTRVMQVTPTSSASSSMSRQSSLPATRPSLSRYTVKGREKVMAFAARAVSRTMSTGSPQTVMKTSTGGPKPGSKGRAVSRLPTVQQPPRAGARRKRAAAATAARCAGHGTPGRAGRVQGERLGAAPGGLVVADDLGQVDQRGRQQGREEDPVA